MVCLSLTKIGILEARTASKTADEHPHDDSRILTCLRRRLELLSPATLPLCETFGLAPVMMPGALSWPALIADCSARPRFSSPSLACLAPWGRLDQALGIADTL